MSSPPPRKVVPLRPFANCIPGCDDHRANGYRALYIFRIANGLGPAGNFQAGVTPAGPAPVTPAPKRAGCAVVIGDPPSSGAIDAGRAPSSLPRTSCSMCTSSLEGMAAGRLAKGRLVLCGLWRRMRASGAEGKRLPGAGREGR